jgi:transcriptional regulator with XRE-family HTH domain
VSSVVGQSMSKPDDQLHPLVALVRRVRVQSGRSQQAVAEEMGVTQSSISDFERGYSTPNLRTAERYMAALGLELTVRGARRLPWTAGTLPQDFVDVLSFAYGVPLGRDSIEVERMVKALNEYDRSEGRL